MSIEMKSRVSYIIKSGNQWSDSSYDDRGPRDFDLFGVAQIQYFTYQCVSYQRISEPLTPEFEQIGIASDSSQKCGRPHVTWAMLSFE